MIKRFAACAIALATAACNGAGLHGSGFVPSAGPEASLPQSSSPAKATLSLRIPPQGASIRPASISPLTQSIRIRVNAASPLTFPTLATSPGCAPKLGGVNCTFTFNAPVGSDNFQFTTFSSPTGGGYALDYAKAVIPIAAGTNPISISLGPVFSNKNDSGPGSLRQALADAVAGETIAYFGTTPVKVVLSSGPLKLTKNVSIAGPGVTKLTIAGNYASQIFVVNAGVAATLSGMTLTGGDASASSPKGGAIVNAGRLALDSVAITGSTVDVASNPSAPRAQAVKALHFEPRPRSRGARAPKPPHALAPREPSAGSQAFGGAIYNSGSLTLTNATLSQNGVLDGSGGAIYNAAGATLAATKSTFSKNQGAIGGAIDNEGKASFSGSTFSGNSGWVGAGSPASGGWGYGAGIYSNGALTVSNCTFTSNVDGGAKKGSYGYGGAIAVFGGTLALTKSTFTSNVAGGGTNGSYGYGGAIDFQGPGKWSSSGNTFASNKAGGDAFGYGGAIFSSTPYTSTNDTFSKNAVNGTAKQGYAYGGAVYASAGITVTQSTFTANAANSGNGGSSFAGAVDSEDTSKFTNASFANNAAIAGAGGSVEGGAVVLNGGTSTWTGLQFNANAATTSGALAYAAGGAATIFAPLTVTNSSFDSNAASLTGTGVVEGTGGAIAMEIGPFTFTGNTVTNNTAATQGGGLWLDDSATVSNTTIGTNVVVSARYPQDGGAGVYNSLGGTLTLTTSTLSGNQIQAAVGSSGGGGMFNAGALAVSNSTFASNGSAQDGGGLENDATGGVSVTNVTFTSNDATSGAGGSIKNLYDDAVMTLSNSIVAGGDAASGDDISNDGTIVSGDYNDVTSPVAGTALSGHTTNTISSDPQLSALANNGGPTKTAAVASGSPAATVPYSVCSGDGITTDQRGMTRGGGGLCTMGAFEVHN